MIFGNPSNATITQVQDNFKTFTITGAIWPSGCVEWLQNDYSLPLLLEIMFRFPNGNVIDWGRQVSERNRNPDCAEACFTIQVSRTLKLRLQFAEPTTMVSLILLPSQSSLIHYIYDA